MPRSRADWTEELAAGMLEDLEKLSGFSIGEMMADAISAQSDVTASELRRADEEGSFEVFPVHDEPTEDLPFDADAPEEMDTDDYFETLFDDLDIDVDAESDQYSEE